MFPTARETFPTTKSAWPTPWETFTKIKSTELSKKSVFVILRSEAIRKAHGNKPDCFGLRPYNDDSCKTIRHCERSEAIHAGTLDCFTPFAMTGRRAGCIRHIPSSLC
jgi:hypothetical protein